MDSADGSSPSSESPQPIRQVMVVDDDDSLREALFRALSQHPDYNVVPCGTFEEARRRLREQHFDVLITDVRLGAFNGLQLAVLAKDIDVNTQVIVISGFDDPVLKEEAEHLGGQYLVKPVASATLVEILRAAERNRDR
jgi:DNA-binding NtrC family response regulator